MKLEIEKTSSDFSEQFQSSEKFSDEQISELLGKAVQTAEKGDRRQARKLFQQVVEADAENETAWFWLASIGEYPEEVLASLQRVLKINPQNERALELSAIARSLLSETFLHHGGNALEKNCKELANECFLRAVSYDSQNENSWLQLSFLANTTEEKTSLLQKVLDINPDNETALSAMESLKRESLDALMKRANSAAIAGEREAALELLEEVSEITSDLEESWILKAYLAESFHEKISCYEKVLQLNPENEAAQAGLFSLRALIQKTESQKPLAEAIEEAFENTNYLNSETSANDFSNLESLSNENLEASPEDFSNAEISPIEDFEADFSEDRDLEENTSIYESVEKVEISVAENENDFEIPANPETLIVSNTEQPETIHYAETDLLNLQESEAIFSDSQSDDANENQDFELAFEPQIQNIQEDFKNNFYQNEHYELVADDESKNVAAGSRDEEPAKDFHSNDFVHAENFFESEDLSVENAESSEEIALEESADEFAVNENRVSTIMIVDDNPTILKLVSGKLEKSGYRVVPAADGEEALSKIAGVTPDLILLDITMPKMNGYQVCKIIRSQEETKDVPVLMISSKDGIFDESRGKMAGSTGFISKPFGPESLMRTVENYLR